jgi:alpha-L-fucosidase
LRRRSAKGTVGYQLSHVVQCSLAASKADTSAPRAAPLLREIKFLNQIDTAMDKALDFHLVVDNYSTDKTKQVRNWLKRWLNLVERLSPSLLAAVAKKAKKEQE